MTERDELFRDRLISLVGDLHGGEARDPELRRALGMQAFRLYSTGSARNWADLKQRADDPTYDSLLRMLQSEGEAAGANGNKTTMRACEILGVSLIARTRHLTDLEPGVEYIDKLIDSAAKVAKKSGAFFLRPTAKAR
jgi:hypothetical protein